MSRFFLKAANSIISFIVLVCLFIGGAYAAYALWDNGQVYAAVEDVRADMLQYKPEIDEEEGGASFDELLAINPDVCAWVTIDNTEIDYPVVQGETNLSYINTDVYGNFALAGSIFLDSRNDPNFSDPYSLLYGHHMENSGMFGDLDLFLDQDFFDENRTGTLLLPDRAYKLDIFACLQVEAGEKNIFDPDKWQTDIDGLISYARDNCLYLRESALDELSQSETPQVLALSTCSSNFTDARTIILAVMAPYQTANQEEN